MTIPSDPSSATEVRSAADALVVAVEAHLRAAAARTGEGDLAVQETYEALRTAAERYDDALFDAYEEVTPWQFAQPPASSGPLDLDDTDRLSVLVRRDYVLADDDALLAAGRLADPDADELPDAIAGVLDTHGLDGLDAHAEEFGLDPVGASVWVVAVDADDATLEEATFSVAVDERVIYRLDEVLDEDDGDRDPVMSAAEPLP